MHKALAKLLQWFTLIYHVHSLMVIFNRNVDVKLPEGCSQPGHKAGKISHPTLAIYPQMVGANLTRGHPP
jgi:hypothetical protein